MKTLEELFLEELADVYHAEKQLTKALPKMAKAATHEDLKEAFQAHLEETEGHIRKVEEVYKAFNKPPKAKKCEAMVGLLKEADDIAAENKGCPTLNAALIAAAQKVEHYEISSYGTLREWADQLDNEDASTILEEILDEERAADTKLTELARQRYNDAAESGEEEDGEPKARQSARARATARA